MDTPRKLGIGIVMIVPAFVLGAAVWALLESWFAVLVSQVIMSLLYASITLGWPVALVKKGGNGDRTHLNNPHTAEH